MLKRADDSGVAFSARPQDANPSAKGVPGRVSRKRGDTIRASDYAPLLASASSALSAATSASASRSGTGRTRSGTVTQTTASDTGGKYKHTGWPTIKMMTNAEPLRADDSEDDELLLKDGDAFE